MTRNNTAGVIGLGNVGNPIGKKFIKTNTPLMA